MCYKPIKIQNTTKYIIPEAGQQLEMWVNCGQCSECRRAKQAEWTARTNYEIENCLEQGGTVYFDTLTYNNKHLPTYQNGLTQEPCFNSLDIRNFTEYLRDEKKNFKYIVTAEYGKKGRPHYHLILFDYEGKTGMELAKLISSNWKKGRTDGYPWKSKKYTEEHNTIKTYNAKVAGYVAKYINKDILNNNRIYHKWKKIEEALKKLGKNEMEIEREKKQYFRFKKTFHRQSQGFGLSGLEKNKKSIIEENVIWYRSNTKNRIWTKVPTPMYFKRKLTKKQIIYNGARMWTTTDEGEAILKQMNETALKNTTRRLRENEANYNIKIDNKEELANYILNIQGRTSETINLKTNPTQATIFAYNTKRDKQTFGKTFYSKTFIGNHTIGYYTTNIEECTKPKTQTNKEFDKLTERINEKHQEAHKNDIELIKLQERMERIRKQIKHKRKLG